MSGVALTFDDGPDAAFTPALLDLLAEHNAVATFFVVGERARRHRGLVQRIADEGHSLGSHSLTHPHPQALSLARLLLDYHRGREVVEDIVGHEVRLFRPPEGHIDGTGAAAIRLARLRPWLWSRDSEDWRAGRDVDALLAAVGVPVRGDIVLFHDGLAGPDASGPAADRASTIGAVRRLLVGLTDARIPTVVLPA